MSVLRIYDLKHDAQAPEVNLESCLAALEPFGSSFVWQVAPVLDGSDGETIFEVTGDLEPVFENLMTKHQRIPFKELVSLSQLTHQLIWSELRGFVHAQDPKPAIFIRAIDSTFFEVDTDRPEIIERVKKCFKNVVFHEHRWAGMRSGIPHSNK